MMKRGHMPQHVPVSLIEGWIDDLTSNLKRVCEKAENQNHSLVYQGMKEGALQVRCRLVTWLKHQKYVLALSRSGRKFLMVRRVNLSDGRYRTLEWYENNFLVTLVWRRESEATRGELMLELEHVEQLSKTRLMYEGDLSFDDLAALARVDGLDAIKNEEEWREWH